METVKPAEVSRPNGTGVNLQESEIMNIEPTGRFIIQKGPDGTIGVITGVLVDGCPADEFQELCSGDGQDVNGADYAALDDYINRFPRKCLVSIKDGRIRPIAAD